MFSGQPFTAVAAPITAAGSGPTDYPQSWVGGSVPASAAPVGGNIGSSGGPFGGGGIASAGGVFCEGEED